MLIPPHCAPPEKNPDCDTSAAGTRQPAFAPFIAAARASLVKQTERHAATWKLGEEQNWAADLHTGRLLLVLPHDLNATAAIQVIGTYNTFDGSFLWGWDHPSVPPALGQHARLARQWGMENKVPGFATRQVRCTEDDAWCFAAVAYQLAGASGVYRGPTGTVQVFMTYGEIQLETARH